MKLPHIFVSTCRRAVAVACLAAATHGHAQAAEVPAQEFFGGCPGPIFIAEDTVVSGKATVEGSCTYGISGFSLAFQDVKLTISGDLYVSGDATTFTIDGSRITAGGSITLDSLGLLSIVGSKLTSETSFIRLPPRNGAVIEGSSVTAPGDVTLGGSTGPWTVTDSKLTSGGQLRIAPGTSGGAPIGIYSSTLFSEGRLTLAGAAHIIHDSALVTMSSEASSFNGSMNLGPSTFPPVDSEIRRTTLSALNGTIGLGGNCQFTLEDVDFHAGGAGGANPHESALSMAPEGVTGTNVSFVADQGSVHIGGNGTWTCTDCKIDAAGVNYAGEGVAIGPSSVQLTNAKIRARGGSIRVGGSGTVTIADSQLQSDTFDADGDAIIIGPGGTRTITDSKFKADEGRITVTGSSAATVSGSKFTAKLGNGVLFTGSSTMTVTDSKIGAKLGDVTAPNGGSVTFSGNKIKAGGVLGFVAESGFNGSTDVSENSIKADAAAMRSFQNTTALNNDFNVDGTIEISASSTCTSSGNDPDVPCM
ncbi:MAG TPA: right-handed parallel beta-helix repeat-containing protein [Candidatus Limnocylindrales bacterium]|nr:right-handed parallel beta-helix repeat-containing protein [Candidatus Limnocylindrales bacterium]